MSYFFRIEGKRVIPHPEILLLEPFKSIFARKEGLKELAYIEFMASQYRSNPYKNDREDVRGERIISDLGLTKWKPDKLIKEGIAYLKKRQEDGSATYPLYRASLKAKEELEDFLNNVNLSERTNSGTAVYKPKDVTGALLDVAKIMPEFKKLEQSVQEELFENEKVLGGKNVSEFAKRAVK